MINNPSEFPPFELVAVAPNTCPLPDRECMCGGRQLTKNNVCWARSARCHDIQPCNHVANQDCRKYRSHAQGRTCVCISIARAVMSPRTSEQLAQMLLCQRTVAPRSSCMWRGLGTRRARGHASLVLLGARVCEQARLTRRMNAARVGLERARARVADLRLDHCMKATVIRIDFWLGEVAAVLVLEWRKALVWV